MKRTKQRQIQDKSNDLAKYSICNLKSQTGAEFAQIRQKFLLINMAKHSSLIPLNPQLHVYIRSNVMFRDPLKYFKANKKGCYSKESN